MKETQVPEQKGPGYEDPVQERKQTDSAFRICTQKALRPYAKERINGFGFQDTKQP